MEEEHVVAANFMADLSHRFKEWQRFDIADRATHLGDHHVDIRTTMARMRALISLVMCGIT